MKKYCLTFVMVVFGFTNLFSQNSYTQIINKAESLLKKDTADYIGALTLYEKAFKKFPDSVGDYRLYIASKYASEAKEYDKAFKYLIPLSELEKDSEGYPGWDYVVGEYAENDYKNLFNDPRWKRLVKIAKLEQNRFFENLKKDEKEFFATSNVVVDSEDGQQLYKKLKQNHSFLTKAKRDYSISFKIIDSLETSYFVHLPKNYNPTTSYPMLFFLHGAVRFSELAKYQFSETNLGGWNRFYTKYADKNNVILVFPKGSKKYNWMTSDDGFFMIPKMVKQIKKSINIDDNKIFISGHSNGATGSFSYLMKQPNAFAGMYGFNTHPKVYTGGTFIENSKNRSFINFSTDQDYYYPPEANDTLTKLMKSLHIDYKEYRYNGFPHWFPQFDKSEPAYQILFSDIKSRARYPFPKEINWEFDDNNYGSVDWINNAKLDTLSTKKEWHKNLNFKIKKWYSYNKQDSLISKKVNRDAFDFPRKSGKIIATYHKNKFKIKTSKITSFDLYLSPEMVNFKKKIKVYVNGKLYFRGKLNYDKSFMKSEFKKNYDRKQIWVNRIHIDL